MRFARDLFTRQPIARKLALLLSGLSVLVMFLMSAAFIAHELLRFRTIKLAEMQTIADVIGANSKSAILFGDPDRALETLNALRARPEVMSASTSDAAGKTLATYRGTGRVSDPEIPTLQDDWL